MHLRRATVRRKGKVLRYAQLVESYRRASDGMPLQRVVAGLGQLDDQAYENLKAALEASRSGNAVVIGSSVVDKRPPKPKNTLRYLDLAVLLQLFRNWKLDELFEALIPSTSTEIPAWAVIAALTLQRCVAPGSKLLAERWFPTTALPELLGIAPAQFNNTRVHRVLSKLERVTPQLMTRLPRRYVQQSGPFSSLFIDVTDTWFVGHGPQLAERAKTKEGRVERKVGIVLLCNAQGYPCRWHVVSGKRGDSDVMSEMVREVAHLNWIRNTPLVCDRSMGHTVHLEALYKLQVHFVTALVRSEFDAYTTGIPHQRFAEMLAMPLDDGQAIGAIVKTAKQTSLTRISDELFVLDLGLLERNVSDEEALSDTSTTLECVGGDRTAQAIQLGKTVVAMVQSGAASSCRRAAQTLGLAPAQGKKYARVVNRLAPDIVNDIVEGRVIGLSLAELVEFTAKHPDVMKQRPHFDKLAQQVAARGGRPKRATHKSVPIRHTKHEAAPQPIRFRGVAYFVPELFVQQRRTAQRRLDDIRRFERQLNERLLSPHSRMTRNKIAAAVDRKLRSNDLIETFHVDITCQQEQGRKQYKVAITLDPVKWARRRRYDGFCLLVAHPDVTLSAAELIALYRSKDLIEKDFESIKSLIKLRPIHHQTDEKVCAHVSICMLSLLLERTLRNQLSCTAKEAIELLAPCTLNRYGGTAYNITEVDPAQRAILKRLKLNHLVDDDDVVETLTPRDA